MDGTTSFAGWLNRNRRLAIQVAVSVAIIYALCWNFVGEDLHLFLYPWLAHILTEGRVAAFATPFSNYTPPYLYLMSAMSLVTTMPLAVIKLLSILSAIATATAVRHLLLPSKHANEAALLVFLIPTVTLNGIFLGQCDGFWTAACLMAVSCALKDRSTAMLIWFGVGIAFKAQAIFIAPFVLLILLQRGVSPVRWAIPGLVYVVAMLPAWIVGWPALNLATVYLHQAQYFNTISSAPNPWAIVAALSPRQPLAIFWVGFAAAAFAIVIYVAGLLHRKLDPVALVTAALLSAMMLPFLLPKMHERFFFLADVLAFALAYLARDRQSVFICVTVQIASLLAYFSYFIWDPAIAGFGGILNTGVIVALVLSLRERPALCDRTHG